QPPAIPLRLAVDLRAVVLDFLAVRRQADGASVGRSDHDHRFGLGDDQMIGRVHDVAHRIPHARHLLWTHAAAALAAATTAAPAHASAAAEATAAHATAATHAAAAPAAFA